MKEYYSSYSSSRMGLITFKKIISDSIDILPSLNCLQGICESYGSDIRNTIVKPLINTFFNVSANNFTLVLNKKEIANKLTIKMVKELKRKNLYENTKLIKNDNENV